MSDRRISLEHDGKTNSNRLHRETTFATLSPEMFEQVYLAPKTATRGDLRHTFGNPTPIAVVGLCIGLTPLSIELMGWNGASGQTATVGANWWFGGMLLVLSGIGEFILGNTFPSVVFLSYGCHFLTFASTYTPSFAAISSFNADGSQTPAPPFLASFGFYLLFMSLLSLIFLICSLRTNAVFAVVFSGATIGFSCGAGAFWHLSYGNNAIGQRLLIATGGCFFGSCMAGWYLLFAIMMTAVDMPFVVPVCDLSTLIKGMSEQGKPLASIE
ncbi:transcriptional activator of ethanol catabolism AlcS [Stipitochalara longipes BDJ]|nr:transcriptional activator of ethanol catabolism AlcS [Stipitochalara longipes BDJ]